MNKGQFWGTFKIMKKSIFLFLLLLLSNINSFSQSIYSKQYLEQASLEELNVYLKESEKLKKRGAIMSIAGPVSFLTGIAVFAAAWDDDTFIGSETGSTIGAYMVVGGLVTTLIGVPVLITGYSRVKRITRIIDAEKASFELAPFSFHNSFAQNTQPGITLRLKF